MTATTSPKHTSERRLATPALRVSPLRDLIDKGNAAVDWIVPDLVARSGLTYLFAPPNSGKTWLTLELSGAVAGTREFLGHKSATGRVLYVDSENGDQLGARAALLDVRDNIDVLDARGEAPLSEAGWERFSDLIGSSDYDLIILDSLRQLWDGNESGDQEVATLFRRLRALATENSLGILIIGHSGKVSGNGIDPGYRGSSHILGAVDLMLCLNRRDQRLFYVRNRLSQDANAIDISGTRSSELLNSSPPPP